MLQTPPRKWAANGLTFAVWALAAASAIAWGFKLSARPIAAPSAAAAMRVAPPPDPAAVARLLGAAAMRAAPVPSLASRFHLAGVVARPSHSGIALISVDGKPAKHYRVGAPVEEGLVLQSVEGRRAMLGPDAQGPATITLELPLVKEMAAGPGGPQPRATPAPR